MSGNGNGRGNGRRSASFADFDFEEVRAALWEFYRCRSLMLDPVVPRVKEGEVFVGGCTEQKLQIAIDMARILDEVAARMSRPRRDRLQEWFDGAPLSQFRITEQTQIKDDLREIAEKVVRGGYRYMFQFQPINMSAVGT